MKFDHVNTRETKDGKPKHDDSFYYHWPCFSLLALGELFDMSLWLKLTATQAMSLPVFATKLWIATDFKDFRMTI